MAISSFNLNASVAQIMDIWKSLAAESYSSWKLTDGAAELLSLLKQNDYRIGIATASPVSIVEAFFLNKTDVFKLIDEVVSCDDVGLSKPNPAVFLKCLELLSKDKDESVIFEDSMSGL